MKILAILVLLLIVSALTLRLWVARFGPTARHLRDVTGLQACPQTPNCFKASVDVSDKGPALLDRLVLDLEKLPGSTVATRTNDYVHATVESRLLGFVDDIEYLLESTTDSRTLQVRSASRIGHSDLGVNRKRVTALLQQQDIRLPSE